MLFAEEPLRSEQHLVVQETQVLLGSKKWCSSETHLTTLLVSSECFFSGVLLKHTIFFFEHGSFQKKGFSSETRRTILSFKALFQLLEKKCSKLQKAAVLGARSQQQNEAAGNNRKQRFLGFFEKPEEQQNKKKQRLTTERFFSEQRNGR